MMRQQDFHELFCSNPIMTHVIVCLCQREISDIWGLQQIADNVQKLIDGQGKAEKGKEEKEGEKQDGKEVERLSKSAKQTSDIIDPFDKEFYLFVWSLLYKKYRLAWFFWSRCNFPVANGLIACSLLKSLCNLSCTHSESNIRRLEEATRYEESASKLLSKCAERSQARTKFLLLRHMQTRGNMSCLQLASLNDENASFLTNPVCKGHLDDIWLRCGINDWQRLIVNFATCLSFILFLISLMAHFSSANQALNEASLAISVLCATIFLASVSLLHWTGFHRGKYQSFRPVNKKMEQDDLKRLQHLTKEEANLLLEMGLPFDLIYEENRSSSRGFLEKLADWCTHLVLYLDTPKVKFLMHVFSFSFYLFIFAYLILSANREFAVQAPSSTEWLLVLYWMSFFAHEMKQLYRGDVQSLTHTRRQSLKSKLLSYWDSLWNRIDVFLLLYFLFMMSIRWYIVTTYGLEAPLVPLDSPINETQQAQNLANATCQAHSVLVLNLYSFYFVFWCLRILQLFAVSESLGPKLIMIRLMVYDVLKIFLYIMIFAVAYAVWLKVAMKTVSQEFLVMGRGSNNIKMPLSREGNKITPMDYLYHIKLTDLVYSLKSLIAHPFWHLFGESFIDAYDDYLPAKNDTTAYAYGYRVTMIHFLAPLMRSVYVLITVVLLLNLMIAIFQYSIDSVQAQADRNWNIYRKAIIFEYQNRAILPAPLSIFVDVGILLVLFCRRVSGRRLRVSVLPASQRFDYSMLKIRVRGEEKNIFKDWVDCICEWEKMMQNHRGSFAGDRREESEEEEVDGGSNGVGRGGGGKMINCLMSPDSLTITEIRHEIRKLQMEMSKLSGLQATKQ